MKIGNAKLCPDCDEVYEGNQCPACTCEHGIVIADKLGTLSSEGGKLADLEPKIRGVKYVTEKLREIVIV